MSLPPAAPLVSLFFFTSLALAGIYAPDCSTTWLWSFNSLGQNACTIAAYMMSTCNGGSFTIEALGPGYSYSGPQGSDDGDLCKCNTVAYSLVSACDGCQGSNWFTWSEFVTNCTTTMPPSTFPNPIPEGTRLPQWALLNVITANDWDASESHSISEDPELGPGTILGPSGPSVSPSTGPTNGNPSIPAFSSTPASSSTSSVSGNSFPNSATPSSHSGTAAGVAVGTIAAISIVIAALLYYRRRQRPPVPPAKSASDEQSGGSNPLMDQVPPRSMSGHETIASSLPETTTSQLRPYNPEDPTTYPTYQGISPPPTSYAPFQSPSSSYAPFQSPSLSSSRNLYTLSTPPDPRGQGPGSSSSNRDLYTVMNAPNSQGQEPGYGGLPIV